MTNDEKRALTFIALLIFAAAALRLAATPEPVPLPDALDLAAHVDATEAAVSERERMERPLAEGERIDPNTATAAELQRLPRVGKALAARIVADRERNGAFRSAAELARVSGIGERTVARWSPHLALPAVAPAGRAGVAAAVPARPGSGVGGSTGAAARAGPRAGAESREPLDLNAADAAALAGLSGIGPVLAARVVAYRDSAGPFRTVDQLTEVRGIGAATLERLRQRVRVRR